MFDFLKNLFPQQPSDDNSPLKWDIIRHQPVTLLSSKELAIGNRRYQNQVLDFSQHFGEVDVEELAHQLGKYGGGHPLTQPIVPQLGALIYDVTRVPSAMSMYFPITNTLNEADTDKFYATIQSIVDNANFELHVWDADSTDITSSAPPSIAFIIAGQIVEIMFFRRDLLYQFFRGQRVFNVYITELAFRNDGGVGGGCYDPNTNSIKLVASRLYEGFFELIPGVAPFLHEFGHMLDHYHPHSRTLDFARGLLPGMYPQDRALFTEEAREKFLAGKRLELERYNRVRIARPRHKKDMPIGHPYVFQTDGEFIAGYLEMFFRNPFYFAELNPTLYESLLLLLKQDPREYVIRDFDGYIKQNREAYISKHQNIPEAGLRVV